MLPSLRAPSLLLASLLLTPCLACSAGMLAEASAEPTACPADQLEISDARQPWQGPKSWTATCLASEGAPEQTWFCSQLASEVFCSDIPASAPSADPQPEP